MTATQFVLGPGVTLMCAVPWAAAGRGKRNNYFSDPQGNIKKKKEKEDGKKTEMEYKRRAEKKHNEEVEKKKITV